MSTGSIGTDGPLLSVAMIVRDDPQAAETLASAAAIADEMLVLDTGSRDTTPDLCRKAKARVIEHRWRDDFSAARNEALEQVKGQWILWLEPGELLPAGSAQALRKFLAERADARTAYLMFVCVPPVVGHASGERIAHVRLVPAGCDLYYTGRVRESLFDSLAQAGAGLETLNCEIHRGSREHDPEFKALRANRELPLLEQEIQERGETADLLVGVGEAFSSLGQQREAAAQFQKAVDAAPRGSTARLEAFYGLLAAYDHDPLKREEQVSACMAALEEFPLDAQLLSGLGNYMLAQNRLDLAARCYTIAMQHGQINPQTWHLADIGEVAAACLSLTQQLQEQGDASRETLRAGLKRWPQSTRLRRHLINLHIKYGRGQEALAEVDHFPAGTPHREALRCAVRGALLASQQNWTAALPYLKTAYSANCRDPLCLRWLAVAHLSAGDARSAQPILLQWQQQEPGSHEVQAYLAAVAEQFGEAPDADAETHSVEETLARSERSLESSSGQRIRVDQQSERAAPNQTQPSPSPRASGPVSFDADSGAASWSDPPAPV